MKSYSECLLNIVVAEQDALEGFVPFCEDCKRVRGENGTWVPLEVFMQNHASASITQTICGVCLYKRYPLFRERIRYFEKIYSPVSSFDVKPEVDESP